MNGGVTLQNIELEQLKLKTLNGAIKGSKLVFTKAEVDSSNGSIELTDVRGKIRSRNFEWARIFRWCIR
ncbi:hypothetical protein LSPH24S_05653 [Lysinibacillus sphaericus]